jgi:hypothetical protein
MATGTTDFTLDLAEASELSELWVPVRGYEGFYEVSSYGRVRSLPRVVSGRFGDVLRAGAVMALQRANKRYLKATLSRDGKQVQHQVHRLVLLAFVGDAPSGFVCDHIDGNIYNNRLENLRWLSNADNCRKKKTAKMTLEKVAQIRAAALHRPKAEVAEEFGVSPSYVYALASGHAWGDAK